jgi:hypothetical protein
VWFLTAEWHVVDNFLILSQKLWRPQEANSEKQTAISERQNI